MAAGKHLPKSKGRVLMKMDLRYPLKQQRASDPQGG